MHLLRRKLIAIEVDAPVAVNLQINAIHVESPSSLACVLLANMQLSTPYGALKTSLVVGFINNLKLGLPRTYAKVSVLTEWQHP